MPHNQCPRTIGARRCRSHRAGAGLLVPVLGLGGRPSRRARRVDDSGVDRVVRELPHRGLELPVGHDIRHRPVCRRVRIVRLQLGLLEPAGGERPDRTGDRPGAQSHLPGQQRTTELLPDRQGMRARRRPVLPGPDHQRPVRAGGRPEPGSQVLLQLPGRLRLRRQDRRQDARPVGWRRARLRERRPALCPGLVDALHVAGRQFVRAQRRGVLLHVVRLRFRRRPVSWQVDVPGGRQVALDRAAREHQHGLDHGVERRRERLPAHRADAGRVLRGVLLDVPRRPRPVLEPEEDHQRRVRRLHPGHRRPADRGRRHHDDQPAHDDDRSADHGPVDHDGPTHHDNRTADNRTADNRTADRWWRRVVGVHRAHQGLQLRLHRHRDGHE